MKECSIYTIRDAVPASENNAVASNMTSAHPLARHVSLLMPMAVSLRVIIEQQCHMLPRDLVPSWGRACDTDTGASRSDAPCKSINTGTEICCVCV